MVSPNRVVQKRLYIRFIGPLFYAWLLADKPIEKRGTARVRASDDFVSRMNWSASSYLNSVDRFDWREEMEPWLLLFNEGHDQ